MPAASCALWSLIVAFSPTHTVAFWGFILLIMIVLVTDFRRWVRQ